MNEFLERGISLFAEAIEDPTPIIEYVMKVITPLFTILLAIVAIMFGYKLIMTLIEFFNTIEIIIYLIFLYI